MKQDKNVQAATEMLAAEYIARFPTTIQRPRIVGREAEYPVVMADGQAADVRRLWAPLMEGSDLKPKYDTGNRNLMVAFTHGTAFTSDHCLLDKASHDFQLLCWILKPDCFPSNSDPPAKSCQIGCSG